MNKPTEIFLGTFLTLAFIGGSFLIIHHFTHKNSSASSNKKITSTSRFLFIGDSTTANPNGFVEKFQQQFPFATVKKIAMVGAKSDWMLPQLSDELSKNKYDVVVILAGSNDIFATLRIDNLENNLQSMYNQVHAQGASVIAITPPNKAFYPLTTDKHRQLIKEFTSWLKNNKSIDYLIDLENLVTKKELFAADMEHINDTGHQILEKEFVNKLNLV